MSRICRKVEDDCPRCDGTGRRGRGYCHRCGGHGTVLTKLVAVDAVRTLDHSIKCKEVRKWTAIAAERSTMMRRHHVMFAKAAQETQTAKSSDYRIN